MSQTNQKGQLSMLSLTVPIAIEQLFRILVSSIDTGMLSHYSTDAVAAVGMVSQLVFFLQLLFSVVGTGCSIVLSQYLGAKRPREDIKRVIQASLIMTFALSAFVMILVVAGSGPFLDTYKELDPTVKKMAKEYFVIYGGFCSFFNAFNLLQGAILRSFGYTREVLISSVVANLINVFGNALSLYQWFGLPVLGVPGVAWSSGISIMCSSLLCIWFIRRRSDIDFTLKGIFSVPRQSFKSILYIGLPTTGESLSYNISQIVIMKMITKLGTDEMAAQVINQTIVRFVFAMAMAIGSASQIKAGYYTGANQSDIAQKKIVKYQLIATLCSMAVMAFVNVFNRPIIGLFFKGKAEQEAVKSLVRILLLYSIYIEFGRSLNLVYVGALKGTGDILFPVLYGIFSNWGIMVLGSYILGMKLGLGLIGFWLAIGTDETTRGIVMFFRWKSGRWKKKELA